jgi:hypothetical protein
MNFPELVMTARAGQCTFARMTFPREHRVKLHSINPIERLNGEIKRRTEVAGIFPNDSAIVRLVGALLLEQNDERAVQQARYMTPEAMIPSSTCQPRCADQPGPRRRVRLSPVSTTTPRDTIARSAPAASAIDCK